MKIECEIDECMLDNNGNVVTGKAGDKLGVCATCSACGHQTTSFGTGDASRNRCLALMREECPEGESNYYVEE